MDEKPVDLVFEGGGVKGIGLAGSYFELYQEGYRPACVAGTSAGAITAALVAAGCTGEELRELVLERMDFPKFADRRRLGIVGEAGELLVDKGLHDGSYFLEWIRSELKAKGVTSFGDLRNEDPGAPASRRYRLQVVASDLTDCSMLVLPQDSAKLGIDPNELEVAEAVRMSMSIPIFFDPVIHQDRVSGRKHLIVDGGLLSNYPIWLFDSPPGTPPKIPTFGMLLVAPNQTDPLLPQPPSGSEPAKVPSLVGYVKAIADTMMQAHDRLYVEQANYVRTIPIPTLGVTTTDFEIPAEKARELFQSGRAAAAAFLKTWDFGAYVARYRTATPPTRREDMLQAARAPAGG
ncbi:MAG TPA: patatin-like phospholipase family protein [Solirubrobacteraceae bacterium]|nr:patatin-like phospholipase family protein [Solirubrobacteraceae bacterium]